MKLKKLSYYYNELNGLLNDGDNYFIKKYTTDGFIKSREMWEKYSHVSIDSFFNDFLKDYNEDLLSSNCNKCFNDISKSNNIITKNQLFDILIRRLVLDCFIGFKAEEIVSKKLESNGLKLHNYNVLDKKTEKTLDYKYNVDDVVFEGDKIKAVIQVKNRSTFSNNGVYICEKRKEFLDKNEKLNQFLGINKIMLFYIYDKYSFINEGVFKFFVNERTGKCGFYIDELIDEEGKLKIRLNRSVVL